MAPSIWKTTLKAALLLQAVVPSVLAQVELNLCASFNTADSGRNVSIYQTNGLCSDFCRADFAYSITQDEACWCSDFTPSKGSQVDMDRCDITCPAYPAENCGGRGLFGYVELNGKLPEGTRGPDDDSPSSTTSSSEEPSSTSTEPETTSSTSSSSSSSSSEEDEPRSTSMVQTLTTDGEIRTVTVVPTDIPTSGGDPEEGNDGGSSSDGGNGGLGTGGIVGIVVGVIGGILVVAGAILFWFFKKRKRNNQAAYTEDPSVRGDSSDRMGSSRPDMAMAGNGGSGSPTSGVGSNSNRNSTLAIDPRMDPFKQGLYMRNASHESINTLRDDHDYSRRIQQPKVLRATNPDPDAAN